MPTKFIDMNERERREYLRSCSQDVLVRYAERIFQNVDSQTQDFARKLYSSEEPFHAYVLRVVNHVFPVGESSSKRKLLEKTTEEICPVVKKRVEKHAPRNEGWLG